MRYLPVLLLAVLASACTYTVNTPAGKVRFVEEKEAVRVAPVLSLASTPTKTDPTLTVHLTKKVHAPIYEAEQTDEVSTEVNFDPTSPIAFLLDALFGDGLTLFGEPDKLRRALTGIETTVLGSRRVRSEPRRTSELQEILGPWKAGAVTIDIDNAVSRWVVADDGGVVSVNLAEEIGLMQTYPRDALNVTVSAVTATDRDDKAFRLDLETARGLYLQGVDMSSHTPGAAPEMLVTVRVDGPLLVVEVINRGGGATSQLRGTLESPFPALSGREMLFGKILPGRQRAWFTELPFPDTTRYAEIPIRIVFSERNGFVPEDVAVTLTVIGR